MRHDKDLLKQSLTIEDIHKLLYELGAENILYNENKNEITTNTICHNISGGGMKLHYYPEGRNSEERSQIFNCYTECSCTMDIYELVRRNYELRGAKLSFEECVNWVAEKTGRSFGFGFSSEIEDKDSSEMDWLNKFTKKKKVEHPELTTYHDNILNVFEYGYYHENFLNDRITIDTMKKFQIGFYSKDERITIPHRHPKNGRLISIRGRATRQYDIDSGKKYLPLTVQGHLYSHPSHLSLYGFWENKEVISKLRKIIVFESEKSVQQCESFFPNNNFAVALSGRHMSQTQVDLILQSNIEEIIIATDKMFKDVDSKMCEEDVKFIKTMGRKFSPYIRTYTLFDTEGLIEYKDSPSDGGKDILLRLMATKKEILNAE